jgi:hypothetical protein
MAGISGIRTNGYKQQDESQILCGRDIKRHKPMTEKENLEIAAAEIFCNCYLKKEGIFAEFLKINYPPLPDATCTIGDNKVDLEIAHLYGSGIDAQRLLGRQRKVPFCKNMLREQRLIPLNFRIPSELNNILKNKSTKKYESERVWLVIRNAFPLWEKSDFINYQSEIILPKKSPFEKIWLICDSKGYSGLLEF